MNIVVLGMALKSLEGEAKESCQKGHEMEGNEMEGHYSRELMARIFLGEH